MAAIWPERMTGHRGTRLSGRGCAGLMTSFWECPCDQRCGESQAVKGGHYRLWAMWHSRCRSPRVYVLHPRHRTPNTVPANVRTPGTPPSLPPEDPAHGTSAGRNAPGSAARNLSKWPFFSASQLHDSRLGVPEDSLQPRRCHEAGNGQKFPQTATCFHAQHLDPVSMHDTTSSSVL